MVCHTFFIAIILLYIFSFPLNSSMRVFLGSLRYRRWLLFVLLVAVVFMLTLWFSHPYIPKHDIAADHEFKQYEPFLQKQAHLVDADILPTQSNEIELKQNPFEPCDNSKRTRFGRCYNCCVFS